MKILHTSDWHIGKKLNNRLRLDEQAEVLDEIVQIADDEKIEIVIIAGDIFDTFVPKAEAEDLFFDVINRLANNSRAVIIISGNHDDATRLCASNPLAEKLGVYISGNINSSLPIKQTNCKVKLIERGNGYYVFENQNGEHAFISAVPYPSEQRFKEKIDENETFEDKMKRWLSEGFSYNANNYPSVLVTHVFMAGSVTSDSERQIELGGARVVGLDLLPKCDYTALGHIHKRQIISKENNVLYSGAILQYAFDECNTDKSVTVFDLTDKGVKNLKEVKLQKGRKLVRVEANGVEDAIEKVTALNDEFIELTVNLNRPMSESETKAVFSASKNIVNFYLNTENTVGGTNAVKNRSKLDDKELFVEYYKSKYNEEPDKELVELYLGYMLKGEENEAD